MDKDNLEALAKINCKNHYKIEANGRCYCQDCMMCVDPYLKEKIEKEGCRFFNSIKNN